MIKLEDCSVMNFIPLGREVGQGSLLISMIQIVYLMKLDMMNHIITDLNLIMDLVFRCFSKLMIKLGKLNI